MKVLSREDRGQLMIFCGFKGIFWCKFNPWSNTPWHWVRPPLERSSLQTDILCSFSDLRKRLHKNKTLQYISPTRNRHQKATNNAQNSTKLQQQYKLGSQHIVQGVKPPLAQSDCHWKVNTTHQSPATASCCGEAQRDHYRVQLEMLNSVLFPVHSR